MMSRKEFFQNSFYSLAESLLKAGGGSPERSGRGTQPKEEAAEVPVPDARQVARADNRHCLAKNCGCFSCVERCEARAIVVVMGEGIRINENLCRGCGTCQYLCPVTPKAVVLHSR